MVTEINIKNRAHQYAKRIVVERHREEYEAVYKNRLEVLKNIKEVISPKE